MYFFEIEKIENAGMAKLVDALDLGSSGETHQSSSLCMPTISNVFADNNFAIWRLRTKQKNRQMSVFYFDSIITIAAQ